MPVRTTQASFNQAKPSERSEPCKAGGALSRGRDSRALGPSVCPALQSLERAKYFKSSQDLVFRTRWLRKNAPPATNTAGETKF